MIASRGCPNKCEFCTSRIIWGGKYRLRSIDNMINEIDFCVKTYGINMINFEDDNFFLNKIATKEFLKVLAEYGEKNLIKPDLAAMNGVSIEFLDEEGLILMKDAGFSEINISLVSYSSEIQKRLKRPFDTKKFKEIITIAKKLDMNIRAYYILGLPEQTKDEIDSTIEFLKRFDIKSFPSVYYNVFSSREEWKMQRSSAFFNETEYLKRKDLFYYFNNTFLKA